MDRAYARRRVAEIRPKPNGWITGSRCFRRKWIPTWPAATGIPKARVRADRVVVLPPVLDHCRCFGPGPEPLHAQALVPEFPIEALVGSVLPRLPWVAFVKRRTEPPKSDLSLTLGGLDSNGPTWEQGTHVRWAVPDVKVGDTVEVKIVEAETADPSAREFPTETKADLDRTRKKSARHYLALYRKQRRQLDREIAHLEHELKKQNKNVKPAKKSRAASRKRTNRR